jgi:hypothetical protein
MIAELDPKKVAAALETFFPTSDAHRPDGDLAEHFWDGDWGAGMELIERYPGGVPAEIMDAEHFLDAVRACGQERLIEIAERGETEAYIRELERYR